LDIPIWMEALGLALLVALSGFFSIAETSMMAINRYRLKALVRAKNRSAVTVAKLLERTDQLLGMVLIGNNLINAAISALVTAIAISHFGNTRGTILVATTIVAFCIVVFAEITPKVIGATFPERIALSIAFILKPLAILFRPIVWFVNLFTSGFLKLFRLSSIRSEEAARLSPEELRALVLESGHFIPKKHTSILLNLLDLEAVTVSDVMTPRALLESIDLEDPIEVVTERISTSYHNKLPVYEGEINRILGILHIRKCIALLAEGPLTREGLIASLSEAYFIPSGTAVTQQLQYFQEQRQRMAVVVDEYGELQGLVTLEDIVEEIVGEFTTSLPRVDVNPLDWDENGAALLDGKTALREINRRLGLSLPLDGPNTLNGLILEELQEIPEASVALRIGNCVIEIVQVQNQAVRLARLSRLPTNPGPQG
jgi:Mg2+/Co2+ transporter CorB